MCRLLVVFFLLPIFGQAFQVDEIVKVRDKGGRVVEVQLRGKGFGEKSAPLLYDKVSHAYEKGAINTYFSSYADGRQILNEDLKREAGAVWQSVGQGMSIQRNSPYMRYPESLALYYGSTGKANLQNPRIWPRQGTSSDQSKLYISWWFRQKNDTRWYFQHKLGEISANFFPEEGDTFSVNVGLHWSGVTEVLGRVIHYDKNTGILHAIYHGQMNNNRLAGKKLRLDRGGATATLENLVSGRGANKFLRAWDKDGTAGTFRLSWTNATLWLADVVNTNTNSEVPEKQWNRMEIFIDTDAKRLVTKVNGSVADDVYYEADTYTAGHSPTIGLIGFDASVDLLQEIWMDDIYMDSSFRRVTLGNARRHSDVTHEEVQYFTRWVDDRLDFQVNFGSLDRRRPTYIYVYSENGVINENGIRLLSPPRMPNP
jgi:hypothetical protein